MIPIIPTNIRQLLLATVLFSAFMLGSALIGQYGFSLHPCDLCLYQRYPYLAIIIIGGLGWKFAKSQKTQLWLVVLCGLLLLVDAGIAFYHTGVEYEWFPGPDACSNKDGGDMTLEQMRAAIMNAPLVSCSQAMAYIFGLSMAAWNALMAFAAVVATFVMLKRVK